MVESEELTTSFNSAYFMVEKVKLAISQISIFLGWLLCFGLYPSLSFIKCMLFIMQFKMLRSQNY